MLQQKYFNNLCDKYVVPWYYWSIKIFMFWRHGGLMRNQDLNKCSTHLKSCLSTMFFVYWTWLNLSTVYTSGAGEWPKSFKIDEKKKCELPNICPSSEAITPCIYPSTTSKVRNLTLRGPQRLYPNFCAHRLHYGLQLHRILILMVSLTLTFIN